MEDEEQMINSAGTPIATWMTPCQHMWETTETLCITVKPSSSKIH